MEKMIKLEQICKRFKNETVLENIDMEFEKGKIYGINY